MKEKKTILKLYTDYIERNPKTTQKYNEISNQFVDSIEKFRNNLKEEQKKDLDEIINLTFSMNSESEKQAFIYAYSLGVKLTTEVFYENKEK